MIIVEYADWATPHADLRVEETALTIWKQFYYFKTFEYSTSTANLITAFRMLIAEGKIPHNDIVFKFRDNIIQVLKDGSLSDFPKGFADTELDMMWRIMDTKITKEELI